MNNFASATLKEQLIKKHVNFMRAYGVVSFDETMFQDLSTTIYDFTMLTKSYEYFNLPGMIKKIHPEHQYSDEQTQIFFEATTSFKSDDTVASEKLMQVLTSANRFRAEFSSTINILNHIYLLKALIDNHTNPRDCFLTLKLIEQYTLSAGALALVLMRFITTLYDLQKTTNDYEYQNKMKSYKYSLLMDMFMLPVNIINLVFVMLRRSDFLPIIGIVGFVFEFGIGCIRYRQICREYQMEVNHLTESLTNKDAFLEKYHACKGHNDVINLLKNALDDADITAKDKSIYLSLLLSEQKTELELKKIRYNLSVCVLVMSIFVIFEQLIFQPLLVSNLSPQMALIVTISIVYCCYLLKGLVVDTWVPHSLSQGVELGDKQVVYGRVKDKSADTEKNNLMVAFILGRTILPLLSIVFLNFFSLEITVCFMFALCILQSFIGDSLRDKLNFVGESNDEYINNQMEEPPSADNEMSKGTPVDESSFASPIGIAV